MKNVIEEWKYERCTPPASLATNFVTFHRTLCEETRHNLRNNLAMFPDDPP